jgi:hypothetical protein
VQSIAQTLVQYNDLGVAHAGHFRLLKALPGGNSLRNKAVVNVAPATNAMSLDAPRCRWMSWMSAKEKARSDAGLKYCLDFSGY